MVKRIVSSKITFLYSWLQYRKNKYYVDIKRYIYHKYCLFPFVIVQTSYTVCHWFIVQDEDNPISSYEPNCFVKVSQGCLIGQFVINKIYLFVCVYFLYCDTLKKYTTTVSAITLKQPITGNICDVFVIQVFFCIVVTHGRF